MLGWLHAVPEEAKEPRIVTEPQWPLPDCGALSYLVGWFVELQLDYGYLEIKAWSDLMGVEPNPKEVELLMLMTNIYKNSVIKFRAKGYNMRPPFDGLEDKTQITKKRLSALFGD